MIVLVTVEASYPPIRIEAERPVSITTLVPVTPSSPTAPVPTTPVATNLICASTTSLPTAPVPTTPVTLKLQSPIIVGVWTKP